MHWFCLFVFIRLSIKLPLLLRFVQVNLQNGQECGGAYLKLLSDSPDLSPAGFRDQTPYTIMFGPDKCGNDNKVRVCVCVDPAVYHMVGSDAIFIIALVHQYPSRVPPPSPECRQ